MSEKNMFDPTTVRGIKVEIACTGCGEKGRIPGGRYKDQGEVVDCPFCLGKRTTPRTITIDELRELLRDKPSVELGALRKLEDAIRRLPIKRFRDEITGPEVVIRQCDGTGVVRALDEVDAARNKKKED